MTKVLYKPVGMLVSVLGGVLAGNSVAGISVVWGWKGAFAALAAVALLSSFAAGVYLIQLRRPT